MSVIANSQYLDSRCPIRFFKSSPQNLAVRLYPYEISLKVTFGIPFIRMMRMGLEMLKFGGGYLWRLPAGCLGDKRAIHQRWMVRGWLILHNVWWSSSKSHSMIPWASRRRYFFDIYVLLGCCASRVIDCLSSYGRCSEDASTTATACPDTRFTWACINLHFETFLLENARNPNTIVCSGF